ACSAVGSTAQTRLYRRAQQTAASGAGCRLATGTAAGGAIAAFCLAVAAGPAGWHRTCVAALGLVGFVCRCCRVSGGLWPVAAETTATMRRKLSVLQAPDRLLFVLFGCYLLVDAV